MWGGLDALCVLYHLTVWGNRCPQLQRRETGFQRIPLALSLEKRREPVGSVPNESLFWMICCVATDILFVCTERRPGLLEELRES